MATAEALAAALALFDHPASVRLARASRLPKGLTFLLEIAAGEPEALFEARTKTGRSEVALRGAAGFFIEQVLLHPGGDSYRILGGDRDTSARELRRNMALLMRWLHPDVTSNGSSENDVYRSTFANRITGAWEAIKTEERRAAYNRSVAAKNIGSGGVTHRNGATGGTTAGLEIRAGRGSHPARQLVMKQVESESFWSRLRLFLGRYR